MSRPYPEAAASAPAPAGQAVAHGHGWWIAVLLVLILGLGAGFAGARYWFKDQASRRYDQLKTRFDSVLVQSKTDLTSLQSRLDVVQGQLVVEQSTRQGLEKTLQAAQTQLGKARDQLAFFDQLLPPGPNGSISIRAFDIERKGPELQYRALLMRNAPGDKPFGGEMQFMAEGKQNGKTVKIALRPVQVATEATVGATAEATAKPGPDELALSFDQFQRSAGTLSLPNGFVPEAITLNVLEGKTVRASRTVKLP